MNAVFITACSQLYACNIPLLMPAWHDTLLPLKVYAAFICTLPDATAKPISVLENMRRAMANLVAIVLATPHQATHLWYHMLKPDELCDTYMTAFMMVCYRNCPSVLQVHLLNTYLYLELWLGENCRRSVLQSWSGTH